MAERADVVVVGAGVIGLAAARALARAGRSVVVVDRGAPCGEASSAAAGMLAPQIEAHAGDTLLELGLASRDSYRALAAECAAHGHDIGLRLEGILHLAFDEVRAAALRSQVAAQRKMGLETHWLERAELLRRQPSLSPDVRGALFAPRDGCVNNVALGAALLEDARAHGAGFLAGDVCQITTHKHRVTGVRTDLHTVKADFVVMAAGAWSGAIVGLRRTPPVEPVRGQMAALPWPDGEPQAVLYGEHGYLVPRGGEALVGSTMERVGFVNEVTAEGQAHIVNEAARILPPLATAPVLRRWSGLRPMTPDGLPILGTDPDLDGVVFATGHGRNGILLAPITGEIVCDLVVDGETRWDLSPYAITRLTG